ncbi:hypothetical protein PMAYCL1PPCAC_18006 [Pristionchus mayeri]|uniref:Uncharacterized protein n=1 Tax=Pristionchus mayeri TaxID=1317129 RepID=A0AAN5CNM2_9BILA|nr:hypothetical protein PMAYCL1PPCAC_18006 [Pristionchus mayeri]
MSSSLPLLLLLISFIQLSLQFRCLHHESESDKVKIVHCDSYCFADIMHTPRERKFLRRGCVKNHSIIDKVRHYVKFNKWPEVNDCPQGLSRYRLIDDDLGNYFEQLCCSHDLCTSSPRE